MQRQALLSHCMKFTLSTPSEVCRSASRGATVGSVSETGDVVKKMVMMEERELFFVLVMLRGSWNFWQRGRTVSQPQGQWKRTDKWCTLAPQLLYYV